MLIIPSARRNVLPLRKLPTSLLVLNDPDKCRIILCVWGRMRQRPQILLLGLLAGLALQGCSSSSSSFHELPPTPEGVSEQLHRQCHSEGVSAGQRAVADMSKGAETFSLLTGGLGAILALTAAAGARDSAYSEAYDACLNEGKAKTSS